MGDDLPTAAELRHDMRQRIRELERENLEWASRYHAQSSTVGKLLDLLDECERALAPFGKFADELVYEDTEFDSDYPNELWPVTDGELKAVQTVLDKLRAAQENADE